MKTVITFLILYVILSSCSNINCDCSFEAFKKLSDGLSPLQVEKILKTKPDKAVQFGGWICYSYSCNNNTINVMFDNGSLDDYSFNTDLRIGNQVIKME